MSELQPKAMTFFDLYGHGQVTADQIDEFIEAWHASDDCEQRSLSGYLGMSEDEYSVWMASHRALPLLAAARRDGLPITVVVSQHLAELQAAGVAANETAIHVLAHMLKKQVEA